MVFVLCPDVVSSRFSERMIISLEDVLIDFCDDVLILVDAQGAYPGGSLNSQ